MVIADLTRAVLESVLAFLLAFLALLFFMRAVVEAVFTSRAHYAGCLLAGSVYLILVFPVQRHM